MQGEIEQWIVDHLEEVLILRETLKRVGNHGKIELYVQDGKLTRTPRIQPSIFIDDYGTMFAQSARE